jgi:hypothetical protein
MREQANALIETAFVLINVLIAINSRIVANRRLSGIGSRGDCADCFPFAPDPFPAFLVRDFAELFVICWLEEGRLFEDIQERSRAIYSIALRIA